MCEYILNGGEYSLEVPEQSLGKIFFDVLKSKNPKDVSIIDGLTKDFITYGEILNLSIKCAISMKKQGIGKNDVVSIISENNINYCIPILSCWYIGARVNAICPIYSSKEMEHMLNITRPKLIFYSELTAPITKELKKVLSFVENIVIFNTREFKDSFLQCVQEDEVETFKPDFINFDSKKPVAAILCSSGTTGLPKAVMVTHIGMLHFFRDLNEKKYGNWQGNDVISCPLPYFHIFGMYILLVAIKYNAKLINIPKFNPDLFLDNIQEYKVNKLYIVPSIAVFLAKSPLVQKYDVSSIRDIICGAAPISKEIEIPLKNLFKLDYVRQIYGLTEYSGPLSLTPAGEEIAHNKMGNAGKLLPHVMAKIVDVETRKSLNRMQSGELCVKGPRFMKGYLSNENATNEMFDEDGWMKTGDVGYFDEDDYLFIVDRIKELIKYKGFQVAPAELESILLSHPGVKEAAVVGKQDERAGELPIAFIVPNPNNTPKEQELIDLVASQLNPIKHLHGGVIFVEELPKNPTGKILRRNLRAFVNK